MISTAVVSLNKVTVLAWLNFLILRSASFKNGLKGFSLGYLDVCSFIIQGKLLTILGVTISF